MHNQSQSSDKRWFVQFHSTCFGAKKSDLTVSKIDAQVHRQDISEQPGFLLALDAAVSDWFQNAEQGRQAFYDGFNIGDLADHTECEALNACLAKVGIASLEVIVISGNELFDWDFERRIGHASVVD